MTNEIVPARHNPASGLDLKTLGQIFSASGFFADAKQAAQAMTKIIAGSELGFGPMSSMLGLYTVKGRPCFSANFMLAAVLKSQRYRYEVDKLSNQEAVITFFRRGEGKPGEWQRVGTSSFTMEDAKLAGLISSDMYRKFPRNMLFSRAASNGCRWFCCDVFAGITPYTPDEIVDRVDDARMTDNGDYVITAVVEPMNMTAIPAAVPGGEDKLSVLREQLTDLAKATNTDLTRVCAHYGCASISGMAEDDLLAAIDLLEAKQQNTVSVP